MSSDRGGDGRVRLGVTGWADPHDPWASSGMPAGIVRGLRELGLDVTTAQAELPAALQRRLLDLLVRIRRRGGMTPERALADATAGPEMALARTLAARARLRPRPAGAVQMSTDHLLPRSLPVVTYEDLTLAMALRVYPYEWAQVSERSIEAWRRRQAAVYARARGCCTASHVAAASVVDDYGVPAERVHVVGLGRNFDPPAGDKDWERPAFLFVGKEWERKNGDAIVRAFAEVRERFPAARLDLVGEHPRLDAPGIEGHGVLRFSRPEERARLEALYAAATCFVMPSTFEPAGISYAEAGLAGMGSIASTSGGAATMVGDAGILVDPGDGRALREAMERFCHPAVAAELGERARRRTELFTWRAVVGRLIRALRLPGVAIEDLPDFL